MIVKITDTEMINFNYIATIRKGYSKTYNCFAIYLNTIGEDNVVLRFETEEEMEKKWEWLQLLIDEKGRRAGMNRHKITKVERQQVHEKYGGHCAYCGKEIEIKDMQVDHMIPLRLGGDDEMSNYMPACRQCNHYKKGNSLEGFRKMIEQIPAKLERDSYIYRVGVNYKNVIPNKIQIVFYFEEGVNE